MMMKIGHRGAAGYEPENTLRSFRKAINLGVDAIELDVQVCKSGELVVIHDAKVNRTTNGRGRISKKTLDELRLLDAGKGEKIPLLSEVLNLVRRKVKVNIELKGKHTAKPVHEMIEDYVKKRGWKYNDFVVSSFRHREIKKFGKLDSNVRKEVLLKRTRPGFLRFASKIKAYSVNIPLKSATKRHVDKIHRKGFKVYVWTVDKPEDITRMKKMGVDGVFSNFPDRL